MTSVTSTRPVNPHAAIWADFQRVTAEHQLTVINDDGLNRHLQVRQPGSILYGWNIITWPGSLATYGDIADGYMFSRDTDMIEFFTLAGRSTNYYSDGAPSISHGYWAEKLRGRASSSVKVYSRAVFIEVVTERLEHHDEMGDEAIAEHDKIVAVTKRVCARNGVDYDEYLADQLNAKSTRAKSRFAGLEIDPSDDEEVSYFGAHIEQPSPRERRDEILADAHLHSDDASDAVDWLHGGDHELGFDDYYETDLTDFDAHFITACYALHLTVTLYSEWARKESVVAERAREPYVVIEGGRVANNTKLPVIDLDEIAGLDKTAEGAADAVGQYRHIASDRATAQDLLPIMLSLVDFVRKHGDDDTVGEIDVLERKRLSVIAGQHLKKADALYWRSSVRPGELEEHAAYIRRHGNKSQIADLARLVQQMRTKHLKADLGTLALLREKGLAEGLQAQLLTQRINTFGNDDQKLQLQRSLAA